MAAIVHGWCGFVEKSNEVVSQQMVLNKLFIPDVLIDIIKDYLYIDRTKVLRKFYREHLNRSITDMSRSSQNIVDIYSRPRLVLWQTGYIYGGGDLHLRGAVCVTCGDFTRLHNNVNGCCPLMWDIEDEPIYLTDDFSDTSDEPEGDSIIPDVSWAVNIPVPPQLTHEEWDDYWSDDDEWERSDDDWERSDVDENDLGLADFGAMMVSELDT